MRILLMLAAAMMTAPATAKDSVAIDSAVFIETATAAADSGHSRAIAPAATLRRGDRVVLLVNWQSNGRRSFTITSKVPMHLSFRASARRVQEVSVDGGRNWGRLGELTIHDHYGERIASPADVTHLRWGVSAKEAARKRGSIAYSATVR